MKISKLNIVNHKHLENLDFDFTYPQDFHIEEKRGKPLDKICFIGQSATGKTGLLELIYDKAVGVFNINIIGGSVIVDNTKKLNGEIEFFLNGGKYSQTEIEINYRDRKYIYRTYFEAFISKLIEDSDLNNIFYFKSNLISDKNLEIFNTNPLDLNEKFKNELNNIEEQFQFKQNYELLFDDKVKPIIWLFQIREILSYRKKFLQKMSEMMHGGYMHNITKLNSEYLLWAKDNPNKLEDFATVFNPILEKLHLEVDLVDTQFAIPIRNKRNDEIIAIQDTSTGTKGLLLSMLPLFKLDTKDSIILIDEPERSLYPDLQMELMEHYQNLAPEAQFIVATHSPFIAASFEPEERFILSFDEKGKVVVNRGTSPIGDDPNDMLHNDFGVNYINKDGQEKHAEYIDLKQKMYLENDETIKKEYAEKLEKIGDAYNL